MIWRLTFFLEVQEFYRITDCGWEQGQIGTGIKRWRTIIKQGIDFFRKGCQFTRWPQAPIHNGGGGGKTEFKTLDFSGFSSFFFWSIKVTVTWSCPFFSQLLSFLVRNVRCSKTKIYVYFLHVPFKDRNKIHSTSAEMDFYWKMWFRAQ